MNRIIIKKKNIKTKKLNEFIFFLFDISDNVKMTTIHDYKLDANKGDELILKYRKKSMNEHTLLKQDYQNKLPSLMRTLKKLGIKTDEEFEKYIDNLFVDNMHLASNMKLVHNKLEILDNTRNYYDIFGDSLMGVEINHYDDVSVSLDVLDIINVRLDNHIKELIQSLNNIYDYIHFKDLDFYNLSFLNQTDIKCQINNKGNNIELLLNDKNLARFKKIKIPFYYIIGDSNG